jgi:hypothetical protein
MCAAALATASDTLANRLDTFVPFLLEKVVEAQRRGFRQFTFRHRNGEVIMVKMPSVRGGKITIIRTVKRVGGQDIKDFQFMLVTTEAELRRDVIQGITSHQAEVFRG